MSWMHSRCMWYSSHIPHSTSNSNGCRRYLFCSTLNCISSSYIFWGSMHNSLFTITVKTLSWHYSFQKINPQSLVIPATSFLYDIFVNICLEEQLWKEGFQFVVAHVRTLSKLSYLKAEYLIVLCYAYLFTSRFCSVQWGLIPEKCLGLQPDWFQWKGWQIYMAELDMESISYVQIKNI